MEMQKNALLNNYLFFMSDSTNPPAGKTGLSPAVNISRDGAAFASAANSAVEIGNGWYKINLTAADLNGDSMIIKASATGAYDWNDARYLTAYTEAEIYAALRIIQALCGKNNRMFNPTYDNNSNLTAATIRGYASKSDCATDTNPIVELTVAATYSGPGQATVHVMEDSQ